MSFCLIFCMALLFNMSIVLEICAFDFSVIVFTLYLNFLTFSSHFVIVITDFGFCSRELRCNLQPTGNSERQRIENKSDQKFKSFNLWFNHQYIMFLFLSFQNNQYIDIYLVLDILFCSKLFLSYSIVLQKFAFNLSLFKMP